MRDLQHVVVQDAQRRATLTQARSLAERGMTAMARELLRGLGDEVPQIVAEVGVAVRRCKTQTNR